MSRTLISRKELAKRWNYSVKTLANWNTLGCGPPVVRPCGRERGKAFYRLDDVRRIEKAGKLDGAARLSL